MCCGLCPVACVRCADTCETRDRSLVSVHSEALTLTGMRGAEARGGATFVYNIRQRYNSGSPATPNQYDGHEETLRNEGIGESIGEAESEL